ncbi:Pentatricopeptide repeat-containing protein [Chlorella vulgaris]
MQLVAALRRWAVQPGAAASCCRPAEWPQPWERLRMAFSTLPLDVGASGNPDYAPARSAASAAASPPPPTSHPAPSGRQDGNARKQPPSSLQQIQQHMQEALGRGDCGTVLRLLPPDSAAVGWSPTDRAALYDLALQAAADSGDADEARRLVGRMWRRGVPVGSVAHTAVLRALCGVGRHADALEYLRRVPAKRQRTAMYSTLLRECNRQGALDVAQACYSLFQRREHTPDASLTAEVVRMLAASGDAHAAEAAWQSAVAATQSDDDHARLHAARVAMLAEAGRLEAAVAALEAMLDRFAALLPIDASFNLTGGIPADRQRQRAVQPAPVWCLQQARNAALAAAQAGGDLGTARRITGLATMRGLPPDLTTYHSLLSAALAHGDGLAAVLEGVEEMKRLGMQPTRETFSILLKACSVEGDPQAALAVFDSMPASGVWQTRVHCNSLLHTYSHAGDLQARLRPLLHPPLLLHFPPSVQGLDNVYRRMQAAGFPPNSSTFHALLTSIRHWATHQASSRAAGEEGPSTQIERTMQRQQAGEMLARWVADLDAAPPSQLTTGVFVSLLHAYSHAGEILNVLLLMRDAFGCQLTQDTSQQLDEAFRSSSAEHGGSSSGEAAAGGGGGGGSGEAGNSGAAGREAQGPSLAAAATSSHTPPSSSSGIDDRSRGGSNTSSSGGDGGGDGIARSPLSRVTLRRSQLAPSLPIFNAAISACTRVGRWHLADGVALLHAMLAAGLQPDVYTYTSLISGCASGKQAGLARELWRQMIERGIRPTIVTHNAMLKVEVFSHGVDAGAAFLQGMARQGTQPDRVSWSTLLAAARYSKRGDIARLAMAELGMRQQESDDDGEGGTHAAAAAAAAAGDHEAAAPEAAAAAAEDDHRWHGYYSQGDDDLDEW